MSTYVVIRKKRIQKFWMRSKKNFERNFTDIKKLYPYFLSEYEFTFYR